jgi:hypothetical protein
MERCLERLRAAAFVRPAGASAMDRESLAASAASWSLRAIPAIT